LSDSVIYMAYYTISKFVNDQTLTADNLTDEFFDYIFLEKGDVSKVSEITKITPDTFDELMEELEDGKFDTTDQVSILLEEAFAVGINLD